MKNLKVTQKKAAHSHISSTQIDEFIEEIGLLFEEFGHPRMAGRIFGLLLVSDEPALCASQIVETLNASKASVSTMTRLLLQSRLVERIAKPADRRDYFRMKPWSFDLVLDRHATAIPAFRKLLEKGRRFVKPTNENGRQSLEEMIDFYLWLEDELPALKKRWQDRSKPSLQHSNQ